MSELKALIFDIDGTVAETERDGHLVSFNRAFVDFGLDWNWSAELYGELLAVSGSRERFIHYAEQYHPEFQPDEGLESYAVRYKAHKTSVYLEIIANDPVPLRPGIKELIDDARKEGIRLAISTTTTYENVEVLLSHSLDPNAMDWFEVVGAGDVVAHKKPAPDIYDRVLQELKLPAQECLAIEDSRNGLESAMAAGIPTIVTPSVYTADQDFDGALRVISNGELTLANLKSLART